MDLLLIILGLCLLNGCVTFRCNCAPNTEGPKIFGEDDVCKN